MSFSRQAFSQEEREQLKKRIKELEEEIKRLKNEPQEESNNLEDMLC